jgi:hypothetical protein
MRGRLIWRALLAGWSVGAAIAFARMSWLFDLQWYIAAGQRLNDGHALYALGPGDRAVPMNPADWMLYSTPFPYSPLLGVIWRPFEALGDLGTALWMVLLFAAMSGAAIVLFLRAPAAAALVAPGLGYLYGSGNVHGFLFAALVLSWFYRDRWWVTAIFGVLAVIKTAPLVFLFLLIADRNWRGCCVFVAAVAVAVSVGVLGAGLGPTLAYPGMAASLHWQPVSLSWLTGIVWLTPALLVAGSLVVAALRGRRAYQMMILTLVIPASLSLAGGSVIGLLALPYSRQEVRPEL